MPTRSGWMTLGGALACFAAGRTFALVELYVLGTAAVALVGLAWLGVRLGRRDLEIVRRLAPPTLTVGAVGRAEITIANRGRRPTGLLVLVDEVAGTVGARLRLGPLAPGVPQRVGYRLPTARRGLLQVGPLHAELTDPFGLARHRLQGPGVTRTVVLPEVDPVRRLPAGSGRAEPLAGRSQRAVASSGIEDLATLRPYVVGDDLRRVHWPSSARIDDLVVRRDEQHWQGRTTVVVDTRSASLGSAALERAISAAAGVVHHAAASDDRVRVVLTDGTDTGMVDGRRGAGALLEVLALASRHDGPLGPLPPDDGGPASVAIVLSGRRDRREELAAALRGRGYGQILVVAFVEGDHELVDDTEGVVLVHEGEPVARALARRADRMPTS